MLFHQHLVAALFEDGPGAHPMMAAVSELWQTNAPQKRVG